MFAQFQFPGLLDSLWEPVISPVKTGGKTIKKLEDILPDSAEASINQTVENIASSIRLSAETFVGTIKDKGKNLRRHQIEWHRKISLSLACLVLFLIGAPIGAIIRKGGLGTPLIFAIAFFMLFYFTSTAGEKMARENTLTPFWGMWLATFLLGLMGIFLIYKAMKDSHFFNKEYYQKIARVFIKFFQQKQRG